ncbi:MAG: biotin/lipoyl-binding protein [Planctomycetes bacterium]|nr:biotin/lipoyl-binding protein [Planctomycetota bacterium]
MHEQADHSVRELGSTRLRLRSDLIFTPQTARGEPYYMVEDPMNSRFFRLGLQEYTFISFLDGHTTIHEALSRLSSVMPDHRLSEQDVAGICRWLAEMDLAHTAESAQAARLAQTADAVETRQRVARCNPLVFRLPICRPDRIFASMAPWLGWIHRPWFFVAWLALIGWGAYEVFSQGERFAASSQGIFASANWLWIAAAWIGLKLVHETAHGVACRYYGASVREMGILFILFAPLAYVDVTSSWRFRSSWQRIHVAAAGMIVELLIAAVAAVIWSNTDAGWLNNLCFNVVLMASLTTLLFNANPLMKFDGYYILSDLLNIPNLYVSGQQFLRYAGRKWIFGVDATLPPWPRREARIIALYGIASFVWRVVVCASLTLAAAVLFHGAGIVLAGLAIVLWLGLPALGLVKYLLYGKPGERPKRLRFLFTVGSASALGTAVLVWAPWPGATEAPAVVEYAPYTVVRAASAGFVRQVHVQSGQHVAAGQLIAVLENHELQNELDDLELSIRQSDVRCRQLELQGKLAACQAEMEKHGALLTRLAEKRLEVQRLSVRAPRDGNIVRRNLDALLGTYLDTGDEIASIGHEQSKELRLSISQNDLEVFAERIGKPLRVNLPGQPSLCTMLSSVIPRASLQLSHPALAAANGGPLPVRNVSPQTGNASGESCELVVPRFTGIAPLTETASVKLRAGQMGTVSCRPCRESIGAHIYSSLARWVRRRLKNEG